jgi:hypothetical protein
LNQTQQATKYADWLGLSSDVRNRLWVVLLVILPTRYLNHWGLDDSPTVTLHIVLRCVSNIIKFFSISNKKEKKCKCSISGRIRQFLTCFEDS